MMNHSGVTKPFHVLGILVLTIQILVPVTSWAGEPRTHDGFFLRLSGGGGIAGSSIYQEGTFLPGSTETFAGEFEYSGVAGDLNIAIGRIVTSNLALHGTWFTWKINSTDFTFDGTTDVPFDETIDRGKTSMAAIGAGATYYFMPVNIYASTSVGLAILSFNNRTTRNGLAFDITLGKEWWVGSSSGLGFSGGIGYHSISNYTGTSFAVRLSATMN